MNRDPDSVIPPVIDGGAFLARVGYDSALASAMVALFLSELPRMLGQVRSAVAAGDAEAIVQSSHALRGSISNFAAEAATSAAANLELLGRSGELSSSAEALRALESELERLSPALRDVVA